MAWVVMSLTVSILLLICEQVHAQCTLPFFESKNVASVEYYPPAQSFAEGSTITYECMIGYKPVSPGASRTVTCNGGKWSDLAFSCTRVGKCGLQWSFHTPPRCDLYEDNALFRRPCEKSCGSVPDLPNGRLEQTGNLFGDTITAICKTGYQLADRGSKVRVCRDTGWDARDPFCEVIKCNPPAAIENGELVGEVLESYDYSKSITYRCYTGFVLSGEGSLSCSEDGSFKPDPPKCVATKECLKPDIPNSRTIGGKKLPPYAVGNFIEYQCLTDFTMEQESQITCTADGWTKAPRCIGPCKKPDFGENVSLTADFQSKTTFSHKSKATFECSRGYVPVDPDVAKADVTCSETTWSQLRLSCKAVPTTTTTATTTYTTTKAPLDGDEESTHTWGNILLIILGCAGGVLVVGITIYCWKRWSKHRYSQAREGEDKGF